MAFQDFDQISERRRLERKQKLKTRITIGVVLTILVVLGAVAAFFIFVYESRAEEDDTINGNDDETNKKKSAGNDGNIIEPKVSETQKAVKMICGSTDYIETCEMALGSQPSVSPKPSDLVKASICSASEELDNAIIQTSKVIKDVETASVSDVCKQVLEDAKDDFNRSRNIITTPELENWLSAVMSYQQTCIDAVPEGETRTGVEQALKTTKELTSNSLAIVSSLRGDTLKPQPAPTYHRRLLMPTWMTAHDTQRLLKADNPTPIPNVTVAKDGSGNFTTISDTLEALPNKYQGRYIIYVKEGVYQENVIVTKKMANITMYGDGSQKTVITGSKNFADGVPTFQTATFAAVGEGFMGQSIGFRNTAGPEKHQAVALRVQSDRSVFLNCRMEGYQDTLYAQTHRQFYRGCYIMGTVDFIFGDAAAVFQNCEIVIRKPMENQHNIVTAQGRIDKHQTTGIVLQKCKIVADSFLDPEKSNIKSYLGRPWKAYSRTIVMESEIEDVIHSEGWFPWEGDFALNTLYYAEYNNIGAGSDVKARVKWPGYQTNFKKEEALRYTVGPFIQGESWLKAADVPVRVGLYS